ncbi:MAG: threonine synthase [Candidatus Omnitrophica bacterium]|nr:threonine synthase [Candidatus Omnitrophota bacterium]
MRWQGIIHRYKKYLPITDETPNVTLNEGNTPLVYSNFLSTLVGHGSKVFLKYEGLNPTGSFKDRGMTLAVSKALEAGSDAIICASTGNTSASAACYAARAGIKCVVLLPKDAIALGKLAQAMIHGAQVIAVDGNFDDALGLVREISKKCPITLVNSINPFRIEGQKTGSFEICEQLGMPPDYHFIPVGNAGNITAYWKGYKEYKKAGIIDKLPKMMGYQAEGAAPIVRGHIVKKPETIATAIRIGNPASWKQAEQARDESKGVIDMVSDEKILEAYKLLANKEGVFCEPASAASVAGLIEYARRKYFKQPATIVCILTGHGLKDPDRAIKSVEQPKVVKPKLDLVLNEIGY